MKPDDHHLHTPDTDTPKAPLFVRIVRSALLLALLCVLAWWGYNRIDEPPTFEAKRWAEPFAHALPDVQNAWVYLIGIGAAANEEPSAFGRRRVDAYEASKKLKPRPAGDETDNAVLEDPTPYRGPDEETDGVGALCNIRFSDCVEWAQQHADLLNRLASENALRLQRYEGLLGMPTVDELYTPSPEEPALKFSDDTLYLNLIARDAALDRAHLAQAVAKIERVALFWQRVDEQAHSLAFKSLAEGFLERYWRLLDAIVDRANAGQLRAMQPAIDNILRTPSGLQRDMQPIIRHEVLSFADQMDNLMPGTLDQIRTCRSQTRTESCPKFWLKSQAYLPQATLNLRSRYADAEADFYASNARDYQTAQYRWMLALDQINPQAEADGAQSLFATNSSGRVLAAASLPSLDYAARQRDREGLRRMFALKIAAKRAALGAKKMLVFLADQHHSLRNPYTGEAFAWDPVQRQISMLPMAKDYWKLPQLNVAYREAHVYRVSDCTQPLRIKVREIGPAQTSNATYTVISCGSGIKDAGAIREDVDEESEAFDDRFRLMTSFAPDGLLDVRFRWRDGTLIRSYEALRIAPDAKDVATQRVDHEGGPDFAVSVEPVGRRPAGL